MLKKMSALFLILALSPLALTKTTWDLYDASILYPLPSLETWDDLIRADASPDLLPESLFSKIPFFINLPNEKVYPWLRVLAIRLDPCFTEGPPPHKCQPQVRFVWQPLKARGAQTSTIDATLHTFYHFENSEFANLIQDYISLKNNWQKEFPSKPMALAVHPLLQTLGLKSNFSINLKKLLLLHLKNKPVQRITFMKLKGMDDIWIFGGLERNASGQMQDIRIATLESTQQSFINQMSLRPNPNEFAGGIFPPANPGGELDKLTRDSYETSSFTEDEVLRLTGELTNFEHPHRFNSGTLDCVSCHLTTTVRTYLKLNFSQFNVDGIYNAKRYRNTDYFLENLSPKQGQTNVLRLFGYFEDQPIVSQRTINETAEAVSTLSLIE